MGGGLRFSTEDASQVFGDIKRIKGAFSVLPGMRRTPHQNRTD